MSDAFRPIGNTVSIAANTTSQNVALPANGGNSVRVCNSGTVPVFVSFATASATAAVATSTPVLPGVEVLGVPEGAASAAAITASGVATVYFTRGGGL